MVVLAAKILARLLVINGSSYVKKFTEKTGGIVIMQHRLKRWWNIPTIWRISFAILFGRDIAAIGLERNFDLFSLLESFAPAGQTKVIYPEILPVITAMLQSGLKAISKDQNDPDSPLIDRCNSIHSASSESIIESIISSKTLLPQLSRLGIEVGSAGRLLAAFQPPRLIPNET